MMLIKERNGFNQMMNKQQLTEYYFNDLRLPIKLNDGRTISNSNIVRGYQKVSQTLTESVVYTNINNLYLWSDIHFGHKNIIKYSNRPFESIQQMEDAFVKNYTDKITNDDVVIWGGDIGFMKAGFLNEIIRPLPGKKILIVGNHDLDRSFNLLAFDCFDETHLCLPLVVDNIKFVITHYPLTRVPEDCYNIHGHIHTNLINDGKHFNMCVEHTNYAPKNIKEFIGEVNAAIV